MQVSQRHFKPEVDKMYIISVAEAGFESCYSFLSIFCNCEVVSAMNDAAYQLIYVGSRSNTQKKSSLNELTCQRDTM
jgi:hypothetical protein